MQRFFSWLNFLQKMWDKDFNLQNGEQNLNLLLDLLFFLVVFLIWKFRKWNSVICAFNIKAAFRDAKSSMGYFLPSHFLTFLGNTSSMNMYDGYSIRVVQKVAEYAWKSTRTIFVLQSRKTCYHTKSWKVQSTSHYHIWLSFSFLML